MQPALTLLFDPLCGWCYAAHPVLEKLAAALADEVQWQLLPTGLFAGDGGQPMTAQKRDYFWQNDQRIAQMTGQPFSQAYYDQVLSDFNSRFDSALATQAWFLIAQARPAQALAALQDIQRVRYVDGHGSQDMDALTRVATQYGLDGEAFAAAMRAGNPAGLDAAIAAARQMMRTFGVSGVPSLILHTAAGSGVVPGGALYQNPEQLTDMIRNTLSA
ncbi:DsbA family protein [Silvimonas iriomotensis]|uniref:DsbA family protein n=1 Tax=Silvimonas iriomotensis TaxID=449662 RepID=A0ABQ2P541_9NEIS|nr:DsbA family protein [Silvimonas iriomotensis]GGP18491.1 DsbA family protein [Silvimonas iriomotensis]